MNIEFTITNIFLIIIALVKVIVWPFLIVVLFRIQIKQILIAFSLILVSF